MADPRARVILEAVKRGEASFRSFEKDLEGIRTKALVVGAAASAAFVALEKHSFESIDSLAKSADAINVATDKLGAFRYAAKIAGVDQDQFDKAIQRQTKSVYDASNGLTTAVRALTAIGLSYKDLIGLTPDQQFLKISDAISKVDNATVAAGAAADLFGARNVTLLNLMRTGREEFDANVAAANRFGIAVKRIDAAKIEQANDAITASRARIEGLANLVAIEVAPIITGLSKEFAGVGQSADQTRGTIRRFVDDTVTGVGYIEDAFYGWKLIFPQLRVLAYDVAGGIVEKYSKLSQTIVAIYDGLAALRVIPVTPIALPEGAADLADSLHQSALDQQKVLDAMIAAGPPSVALKATIESWRTAAEATAQATAQTAQNAITAAQNTPVSSGELELIDTKKIGDKRIELMRNVEDVLTGIARTGLRLRQQIYNQAVVNVANLVHGLEAITAIDAQNSKHKFEVHKKIQEASALVDTYRAVTLALASGPPPWNFVQAALVAAYGFKQVQAIAATSWQGGGSGGAGAFGGGGGGGSSASTAVAPVGQPVAPTPSASRGQPQLTVVVQGSVIGAGGARQLAEELTKLLREHGETTDDVLVSVRSRNGQDLMAPG